MKYIVEAFGMSYVVYHKSDEAIANEEKEHCSSREEFERALDSDMMDWNYDI